MHTVAAIWNAQGTFYDENVHIKIRKKLTKSICILSILLHPFINSPRLDSYAIHSHNGYRLFLDSRPGFHSNDPSHHFGSKIYQK